MCHQENSSLHEIIIVIQNSMVLVFVFLVVLLKKNYICKSTTYWQCSRSKLNLQAFKLLFPSSFTEWEISVNVVVITLFLSVNEIPRYGKKPCILHMHGSYVGGRKQVTQISGWNFSFLFLTKGFSPQDEILLVFCEGLRFCGNWSNLADINIEAKQVVWWIAEPLPL